MSEKSNFIIASITKIRKSNDEKVSIGIGMENLSSFRKSLTIFFNNTKNYQILLKLCF